MLLQSCKQESSPESEPTVPSAPEQSPAPLAEEPPTPPAAELAEEEEPEELKPEEPPAPHPGPWLWVKRSSAGVYFEPKPDREKKYGYVKQGGKVPILPDKVEGSGCSSGWYAVASGGYICSAVGTTDEKDPIAQFPPRQPDIESILPYPYVRNAHNGTPLYRSIPTKEQMYAYEPYLPAAKKAREAKNAANKAKSAEKAAEPEEARGENQEGEPAPTASDGKSPTPEKSASAEKSVQSEPTGLAAPAEKPWWETGENLHEITLEALEKEKDGILIRRMMRGFYVAVDKNFSWHGRSWYKTTKGLVAPADRFWKVQEFDFQGVDLSTSELKLPLAWPVGNSKQRPTYKLDPETNQLKAQGSVKKFTVLQLTGNTKTIGKNEYLELADGLWVRAAHVRRTTPEPRPEAVGSEERWIDIDISQQTLVFFEGDRPLYATILSSGRESSVKAKDHRSPRGMWRVREKHLVATMDGDGSAAGDLPYSIEDVPYIMYYDRGYATHTAFWHQNFGYQMSHGCINLSPLDAKWIFFHAEPRLPDGLHGVWSSEQHPGTMIVVHD